MFISKLSLVGKIHAGNLITSYDLVSHPLPTETAISHLREPLN
jgi:hypothetical protein